MKENVKNVNEKQENMRLSSVNLSTEKQIRHDSGSKRNRRKSKRSEPKRSWGVWVVLGGRAPYQKLFGLQRPLDSLKINSNFINCGYEARQKS